MGSRYQHAIGTAIAVAASLALVFLCAGPCSLGVADERGHAPDPWDTSAAMSEREIDHVERAHRVPE